MTEIYSTFSEKALLNKTTLNLFCPSNAEKKRVDKTFLTGILNDRLNEPLVLKKGIFRTITKPLRFAATISYVAVVIFALSPIAVIYDSTAFLYFLSIHSVKKIFKGDNKSIDKAYKHAIRSLKQLQQIGKGTAFFLVSSVFILNGGLYFSLALAAAKVSEMVFFAFVGTICVPGIFKLVSKNGFKISDSSSFISFFASNSFDKNRQKIDFGLDLRNHFGMVNEKGELLNYTSFEQLVSLPKEIIDLEYKLILQVRNANTFLPLNQEVTHIVGKYFVASDVINRLKKFNKEGSQILIEDLKDTGYKLDKLYDIYRKIYILSNGNQKTYPRPGLSSSDYATFFVTGNKKTYSKPSSNEPYTPPPTTYPRKFYAQISVEAKNISMPMTQVPNNKDAILRKSFNEYKQFLQKAKFKLMKPHEIFGINYNNKSELEKTLKFLRLVIHPDKNRENKEEADNVFKDYTMIKEELEKPTYKANWNAY